MLVVQELMALMSCIAPERDPSGSEPGHMPLNSGVDFTQMAPSFSDTSNQRPSGEESYTPLPAN